MENCEVNDPMKLLYQAGAVSEDEVTLAFFRDGVQVLSGNALALTYEHDEGLISFDRAGNVTYKEEAPDEQ